MYWNYNYMIVKLSDRLGLIETWDVLKFDKYFLQNAKDDRLIETWDVLKYEIARFPDSATLINRNMRCIEISSLWIPRTCATINRNMRCIEIPLHNQHHLRFREINRNMRCIEINVCFHFFKCQFWINRNMRCIEIA